MPTEQKRETVARLKQAIESSESLYIAEFSELSANDMGELRGQVKDADAQLVVVKNRLFRLAIEGTQVEALVELMTGPRAVVFCYGDPVAPAKAIATFADDHSGSIVIKAGFADGQLLDEQQANRMATLPSRQELLASVVSGIAAPVTDLVYTLSGLVSDLVLTLQAVADQKAETAA